MTFSTPAGPVQALANASLTIAPREFVSLLGPSGCGKSTLLRLVADILVPTEGRIEVGGEPPGVARRRRVFGFVFQDSTLLPWRNALQNVLLPLEIGGDARRGPAPTPWRSSSWSGCAASRRPIRGSCRAGCGSGSRSRGRSSRGRRCC